MVICEDFSKLQSVYSADLMLGRKKQQVPRLEDHSFRMILLRSE